MGVYLDGDLYVAGRRADLIVINGSHHYPQDIEGTTEEASPMVRRGHVTVFTVPAADSADADERLVIVTERAPGTGRADPTSDS